MISKLLVKKSLWALPRGLLRNYSLCEEIQPYKPKLDVKLPMDMNSPKRCRMHKQIQFMDIRCKTCIVTGGAKGVGLEVAKALLNAEADTVVIADIDRSEGPNAMIALNSKTPGNRVKFFPLNYANDDSFAKLFQETTQLFGQVDIVVNCASVFDETPAGWPNAVRTNLGATVRGTFLAYCHMATNNRHKFPQGGCIVNLSSWGSLVHFPSMPMFATTAAGINGLSASFGTDFHFVKTRVRCLSLCISNTSQDVLKDAASKQYNSTWRAHSEGTALKCPTPQDGKSVGLALCHIIRFGHNGSIYGASEGKLFKYIVPDYTKLSKRRSILY